MAATSSRIRQVREAVMPLEIECTRAVYDDERDIVAFMGMDGARMVRCSVTREALYALAARRAQTAREMLEAYRLHADRIHQVAVRKYERRQFDLDGSVLVIQRDVAGE